MKLKTKDLALVGLFAALMAVCAWISIPVGPVPVTLQTFAVFLSAALLGSKRGTLAVLVYILLGVVGLPVFARFSTLNPVTFGYVLGFLPPGHADGGCGEALPQKGVRSAFGHGAGPFGVLSYRHGLVLLRDALSGHRVLHRKDLERLRHPLYFPRPREAGAGMLPVAETVQSCKINVIFWTDWSTLTLLPPLGHIRGV